MQYSEHFNYQWNIAWKLRELDRPYFSRIVEQEEESILDTFTKTVLNLPIVYQKGLEKEMDDLLGKLPSPVKEPLAVTIRKRVSVTGRLFFRRRYVIFAIV